MSGKESILYACSKCFTRHPFEELSQGQQLCKVKIRKNISTISSIFFKYLEMQGRLPNSQMHVLSQ